jgi:pimeloyl-ACP methyl ester carboxylesterase
MVLADPTVAERASQYGPIVERSRKCREAFQMAPGSEGETRPPECAVRPPADGAAAWGARLSEIETILLPPPPLPDVPLIVLAAVKGLDGPTSDVRRGQLAALARQSPRGELRVLADSGHMVMRDRPDAIAEAVFAILASRESQVTPSALPPKPAGKGEMP